MARKSYVEYATEFVEKKIEKNLVEFNKMGKTYREKVEVFCLDLRSQYWFDLIVYTFKMKRITGDDANNMNPNFVKFMDKVIDNITIRGKFINNN